MKDVQEREKRIISAWLEGTCPICKKWMSGKIEDFNRAYDPEQQVTEFTHKECK